MAEIANKKRVNKTIITKKPFIERVKKEFKNNWQLLLISLPTFIWFLIFHYGPLYGIQLAFKNFVSTKGIWGSEWIGFSNFLRFFKSYNFLTLIKNTLGVSLYHLAVGFPAPIILALLINEVRNLKFKKTVQLVTYAPHFISTVVLVGMLNVFFSQTSGLFNIALQNLGFKAVPLMESSEWFKTTYVFSGIWQGVGWGTIIYIATLAGVSPELHEAAIMDGATKFQRIIHINIPSLIPTAVILLILQCGRIMNVGFEKVYLMQNALNMRASDVISTYVFRVGLQSADYGFGTAVGLFNSVINCVLLILVNKISKKLTSTGLF